MPVTDDTIVTEDGGTPTAVTIPTVNASLNVWGTILNAAANTLTTALNYTQGLITAVQAAAAALAARVTAIEGNTPYGWGFATGVYVFGKTCRGFNTSTLTNTNTVFVPFDGLGAWTAFAFRGDVLPLQTVYVGVFDSDSDGLPSDLLGTGSIHNGGITNLTGDHVVTISATTTRRSWLCVSTGAILETRGTTGAAPDWDLGSASLAPATAADIISYVTDSRTGSAGLSDPANGSGGVTWTAHSGFAPTCALRV